MMNRDSTFFILNQIYNQRPPNCLIIEKLDLLKKYYRIQQFTKFNKSEQSINF